MKKAYVYHLNATLIHPNIANIIAGTVHENKKKRKTWTLHAPCSADKLTNTSYAQMISQYLWDTDYSTPSINPPWTIWSEVLLLCIFPTNLCTLSKPPKSNIASGITQSTINEAFLGKLPSSISMDSQNLTPSERLSATSIQHVSSCFKFLLFLHS